MNFADIAGTDQNHTIPEDFVSGSHKYHIGQPITWSVSVYDNELHGGLHLRGSRNKI
jgi:hypothetical protein